MNNELFLRHCDEALAPVSDMMYYSSVALCAFDAVFSIRAKYDSVVSPLIDRFCKFVGVKRTASDPYSMPSVEDQVPVSVLRDKMEHYTAEELADKLENHQLTSTKGGILKTEAFLEYLEVFRKYGVDTYQDVNRLADTTPEFEQDLRSIKGQNVSVDYFFMLAGDVDGVKVDTLLRNFVKDAVGKELGKEEIKSLFRSAAEYYRQHGYPDMTARHLDHIVWTWQRNKGR